MSSLMAIKLGGCNQQLLNSKAFQIHVHVHNVHVTHTCTCIMYSTVQCIHDTTFTCTCISIPGRTTFIQCTCKSSQYSLATLQYKPFHLCLLVQQQPSLSTLMNQLDRDIPLRTDVHLHQLKKCSVMHLTNNTRWPTMTNIFTQSSILQQTVYKLVRKYYIQYIYNETGPFAPTCVCVCVMNVRRPYQVLQYHQLSIKTTVLWSHVHCNHILLNGFPNSVVYVQYM